jgi:hypothetical protein
MHISKEQLAVQELILMKDSQALLESINLSGKADTSRDVHSTMDSVCCDEDFENSLVHDFSVIEKRSPKKITRKGTRQSILKPIGRNNDESKNTRKTFRGWLKWKRSKFDIKLKDRRM